MVVRRPVVAKVKVTGTGHALAFWQVPSRCVAVLQRRTPDAQLVHRHHRHLLLDPMTRMKMRTKTETEMTLWPGALWGVPP